MMISPHYLLFLAYITICLLPALVAALFGGGRWMYAAAAASIYALGAPILVVAIAMQSYSNPGSFDWPILGMIFTKPIEASLVLSIPGWLCVYPAIRDRRKGDELF